MFVLFKNILFYLSAIIDLKIIIKKETEICEWLAKIDPNTQIKGNEDLENLVAELIKCWKTRRFRWLEFCTSTFWTIMLAFKLELNINGLYLNPVIYSLSGLCSTIINIFW